MTMPHVARNTGEQEWYTPEPFLNAARSVLGGIDCDPASSEAAQRHVQAGTYWTEETDGLRHPWYGRVWLNPPYGQPAIGRFISKLLEERERFDNAIVLVNNATETRWGSALLDGSRAVCFPTGRIRYLDAELIPARTPLQGQFLAYVPGTGVDLTCRFLDVFELFGSVWRHQCP